MNVTKKIRWTLLPLALSLVAAAAFVPGTALAVDAAAAKEMARQNRCFKCHSVDKEKTGPAWKAVAAELKGNKDAEATLIKHLTGKGKDPKHPVAKGSADDVKNLAEWILSL